MQQGQWVYLPRLLELAQDAHVSDASVIHRFIRERKSDSMNGALSYFTRNRTF